MKATLFAVVFSSIVLSLPSYSANKTEPSTPPPIVQVANKINLNKATVQMLTKSFKGIGQKRAEAIVSYRDTHGNFKSIADLAQVRGLGKTFVNNHLSELQEIFVID